MKNTPIFFRKKQLGQIFYHYTKHTPISAGKPNQDNSFTITQGTPPQREESSVIPIL